ncbi:pseudouridine synthase, partial [Pseudomonas syringae group genomosp. 7]|uniref:pseudouridine synthase n=1 Tax=Pseudomonas syringae group genomosp. 7 TaxID=251699 RepID=UPI00377069ED
LFPALQIDKFYEAIAPALPGMTFPRLHDSRLIEGEPFFSMQEGAGTSNTRTQKDELERKDNLWRYRLYPVTGKKHQLRVHM